MIKPPVVKPNDEVTTIGYFFNTPVVVKGKTGFPITEIVVWSVMSWLAGKRHPERSMLYRLIVGALTMPVLLGSEWGHNFAHAAAAHLIGKPMDAMRITWGMPLCVYFDINDSSVTPRQHIFRALGGPLFNAFLLPLALIFRRYTRPTSVARDVADAAVGMNTFLCTASLLPIPVLDGGPILKWSLVDRGCTSEEADQAVGKVNGFVGLILAAAGVVAFKKRLRFFGALLAQFAALALAFALGIIKEKD